MESAVPQLADKQHAAPTSWLERRPGAGSAAPPATPAAAGWEKQQQPPRESMCLLKAPHLAAVVETLGAQGQGHHWRPLHLPGCPVAACRQQRGNLGTVHSGLQFHGRCITGTAAHLLAPDDARLIKTLALGRPSVQ